MLDRDKLYQTLWGNEHPAPQTTPEPNNGNLAPVDKLPDWLQRALNQASSAQLGPLPANNNQPPASYPEDWQQQLGITPPSTDLPPEWFQPDNPTPSFPLETTNLPDPVMEVFNYYRQQEINPKIQQSLNKRYFLQSPQAYENVIRYASIAITQAIHQIKQIIDQNKDPRQMQPDAVSFLSNPANTVKANPLAVGFFLAETLILATQDHFAGLDRDDDRKHLLYIFAQTIDAKEKNYLDPNLVDSACASVSSQLLAKIVPALPDTMKCFPPILAHLIFLQYISGVFPPLFETTPKRTA